MRLPFQLPQLRACGVGELGLELNNLTSSGLARQFSKRIRKSAVVEAGFPIVESEAVKVRT